MSHGHFILKCKECGTVIAQCRCPDPAKTVQYGICDVCQKKKTDGNTGELRTTEGRD